jgi:hypothetical protein
MPSSIEKLDTKIFIRSSDSRGDFFPVALKGLVGMPKLSITPKECAEQLDFGIVRSDTMQEKEIRVTNEGNIHLKFSVFTDQNIEYRWQRYYKRSF